MSEYNDYTDEELTSLLVAGDGRAFETIYRRYARDLYRYVRGNISLKEDCEEIVQDVFESLWERHEKLSHITFLKGYLFRSVRYMIIAYIRHQGVKERYAEHFKLFEVMYDTLPEESRSETTREVILKLITELPPRCQVAVKLRLTENLSNGEIASRMNIGRGTVETYMSTAFTYLRAYQNQLLN